MANWEDFEIECTNYLNDTFGEFAKFIHQGGANSTNSDILVKTKSGTRFFIEAKMSPAQCGQFVLLPDIETQTFQYSSLNTNKINAYAKKIIEYMNQSFDEFRNAGTAGKDIILDDDVFSGWIVQMYKEKNVRYFITGGHTIFPIERFKHYFHITAKYRIKRSGSGNVGKSHMDAVLKHIHSNQYHIQNFRIDKNKLFVTSSLSLHNRRFILSGFEYMFSSRNDEYEIRRLSNTYNANVIFSISQTETAGLSNHEFISALI